MIRGSPRLGWRGLGSGCGSFSRWTAGTCCGAKPRRDRPGTGPPIQGRVALGRPPQRAKAACRRRHALPGCYAALPKYKTAVTAWRLKRSSNGRQKKNSLRKAEKASCFTGFPRSDKHGGRNETTLHPPAGAHKSLSLCSFFPSKQPVHRLRWTGVF